MSSSKRIAYCAAEQNRAAAAYARDRSNEGQPLGSARGPGPDAKVLLYVQKTFLVIVLCVRHHVCWLGNMVTVLGIRAVFPPALVLPPVAPLRQCSLVHVRSSPSCTACRMSS